MNRQEWTKTSLGKSQKTIGTFNGRTAKNTLLAIVHIKDCFGNQNFIPFIGEKPVGRIFVLNERSKREITPIGNNDKREPIGIKLDMGELKNQGIMSALHAHALDSMADDREITEVYIKMHSITPRWRDRLEKMGAEISEKRITWNFEKLRESRPWKKFLLREEK